MVVKGLKTSMVLNFDILIAKKVLNLRFANLLEVSKNKKKDITLHVCIMNISSFISGLNIPFMFTQLFKKIINDEVHSFSWIWTNAVLSILARMIHKIVLLEIKLQLKSSHTYITIYHDILLLT